VPTDLSRGGDHAELLQQGFVEATARRGVWPNRQRERSPTQRLGFGCLGSEVWGGSPSLAEAVETAQWRFLGEESPMAIVAQTKEEIIKGFQSYLSPFLKEPLIKDSDA